ncbi:MAG: hypothetical protein E7597_01420 [Ruminococcaceae bacterium]|nr:hypothetical protein [Oscillospiraceae bacterium]
MTKEQIYEIIEDIAADANTSVEDFLKALVQERAAFFNKKTAAMPKDTAAYVAAARKEALAARTEKRKEAKKAKLKEEIKRFRQLFPNVKSEGIPESVWKDMTNGIPLPYAYALYLAANQEDKSYAESVNAKNSGMAPPPVNADEDEGELTMEQVEAMSPEAIKKSFPKILRSLNKWKI